MAKYDKHYKVQHTYMRHSGVRWRVTVAAIISENSDWAAYVCASMEQNPYIHTECEDQEGALDECEAFEMCKTNGNKLTEEVARAYFPGIKETYRS